METNTVFDVVKPRDIVYLYTPVSAIVPIPYLMETNPDSLTPRQGVVDVVNVSPSWQVLHFS